jgi:hypothetical protein
MRRVCVRCASLPGRTFSYTAGLLISLGLISGCGGSSKASQHLAPTKQAAAPPVCRPAAAAALARDLSVPAGSISARPGVGNNGQPECRFTAGRDLRVVANLDGAPQAYFRLERTIVETGQLFRADRTFPAPEQVARLGLDASWFPTGSDLMTTDGHTLVTVEVHWPRVPQRRMRTLAAGVARQYLGPLDWKAADPPGT